MDYRNALRIDPDSKVKLAKLDPAYTGKHESEEAAKEEMQAYERKLTRQQALLYAEHKHSILIVLQALDAGGKDGTIKHVFSVRQPAGRQRRRLQAADPGRARARFSLARPPACARQGRDRDLQPLALRGRARHARPQDDRQGDLDGAL